MCLLKRSLKFQQLKPSFRSFTLFQTKKKNRNVNQNFNNLAPTINLYVFLKNTNKKTFHLNKTYNLNCDIRIKTL